MNTKFLQEETEQRGFPRENTYLSHAAGNATFFANVRLIAARGTGFEVLHDFFGGLGGRTLFQVPALSRCRCVRQPLSFFGLVRVTPQGRASAPGAVHATAARGASRLVPTKRISVGTLPGGGTLTLYASPAAKVTELLNCASV